MNLEQGPLGYAIEFERRGLLESSGNEPKEMLARMADEFPKFDCKANPLGVVSILNQGNQGSCQGHSLAQIFSICFFLATGRKEAFSRACGYYESQRYDGIRGDSGSTLSAGQKVAKEHGMCTEAEWPYPSRYDPNSKPGGIKYQYKLDVSKPFTSVDDMAEWLNAGLPIQTGIAWNETCNREVVSDWRPGGGGHSTTLWQLAPSGNAFNINSWGGTWCQDGMHEWTWTAIAKMVKHSWSTFIGYAPTRMSFPEQPPIS